MKRYRQFEYLAFGSAVLMFTALALWLAAFVVAGRQADARNRSVAAAAALDQLRAAALDSETGLRGYVLTGRPDFLAPYTDGRRRFQAAYADLSANAPSTLDDELQAINDAYNRWSAEWAEKQLALVAGGQQQVAVSLAEEGSAKALFDDLRDAFAAAEPPIRHTVVAQQDPANGDLIAFALTAAGSMSFAGAVVAGLLAVNVRRRDLRELGRAKLALAEERELSTQRADMLATWSHDLRNPLTALVLNADVLREQADEEGSAELRELAASLSVSARRTASLAAELLDFSRLEAGSLHLRMERIDLRELAQVAIEDLWLTSARAQVLIADETSGAPITSADATRLRMVLRNLLENAVRYGAPPIVLRIGPGRLSVEDGGPGIPEHERDLVFGRFQRGEAAAGKEGSGIGLYLAKQVAEMHGGSLTVRQSELGGAAFELRLPLQEA